MTEAKQIANYGVVIHRDFIPLYVDEQYAKISGYDSVEEIMHLNSLFEIISPNFHAEAQNNYHDMMQGDDFGLPIVRRFLNQNKQGQSYSVIAIDQRIVWQGEPALQVTIVDISAVNNIHRELLSQEKKYKDLFWNSAQGFIVHQNFEFVMVNPAYVAMIGADSIAEVMALQDIRKLIPEEFRESAVEYYHRLMDNKTTKSNYVIERFNIQGERKFFHIFESVIDWNGTPAVQQSLIDVTKSFQTEESLRYQASHDELTGLYNRRAILNYVENRLSNYHSISCILIDLDDFKAINDLYGHDVGDMVLEQFSALCKEMCDDSDVLGRWGGEEFIIIQFNKTKSQSIALAEDILTTSSKQITIQDHPNILITASIGLDYNQSQSNGFKELVKNADDAMYQAKNLGKNQVVIF